MVEVVAVLVLIGIISAVVVPRLSSVGESEFAERLLLKSNLRYARQRSMETAGDWGISFGDNSYTLVSNDVPTGMFPSIDSGTHVSSVSFSSDGTIEFESATGVLSGGNQTVSFANSSVTVYSTGAIE